MLGTIHELTVNAGRFGKGRFVLARSISETTRVRYLLGLSSAAERERIESEYFGNDDAFQELLTAEDDLFDAYARGELTGEERRRFEKTFVRSQQERTLFACAFAETVSPAKSVESKVPGTWLDAFKVFPAAGLLRIATVAMVIVVVTVLAWLVIDRRRVSDELHALRAESAELRKQTEALRQSNDTERSRTAELIAPPANLRPQLRPQPYKPKHRERQTIAAQPVSQLPEVKTREMLSVEPVEEFRISRDDATLGSTFVAKKITQLPLEARNVPGLLTLQTATTRDGYVAGARADQSEITLDGVDINLFNSYNPYLLIPRNTSDETTIHIPRSVSWIRFKLTLNTVAIHEEYRLTIRSAAGYPVTSVDWIGPLESGQTFVDTPVITTGDLPSGDYVLSLIGKEADGSFVKVEEYLFKVIKLY